MGKDFNYKPEQILAAVKDLQIQMSEGSADFWRLQCLGANGEMDFVRAMTLTEHVASTQERRLTAFITDWKDTDGSLKLPQSNDEIWQMALQSCIMAPEMETKIAQALLEMYNPSLCLPNIPDLLNEEWT